MEILVRIKETLACRTCDGEGYLDIDRDCQKCGRDGEVEERVYYWIDRLPAEDSFLDDKDGTRQQLFWSNSSQDN